MKGLLPCLKSITTQVTLEQYRGLTVAVDAMCWLHKGIFTANVGALAKYQYDEQQERENQKKQHQDTNKSADKVLASTVKRLDFDKFSSLRDQTQSQYQGVSNVDAIEAMSKCIDYVTRHSMELQKKYGLELVLVIDGDALPSKFAVNEKRRKHRAESFQKGMNAEKRGDGRQARKFFSQACSITYEMRHELIVQCKRFHIPFVVAPYEADAQLAKLAHSGEVDLVISEDSDMLAYGCPRVLFKIDFKTGKGDEIQLMRDLAANEPLSFRHWNHDMFVYMCILAGCDYFDGVPGVGIQTAHKLIRIHRKPNKIFNALKTSGKHFEGFEESFLNAYRTFRHQRVFCSQKRAVDNLFKIKEATDTDHMWEFLGPWIEPSIGIGIAEGKLHPKEKIPWDEVKGNKFAAQEKLRISSMIPVKNHERKRMPTERSPLGKYNGDGYTSALSVPKDKSLFAFFRPKKRNNNHIKEANRPPIEEVQVDQNRDPNILPLQLDGGFSKVHCQSVPSNYHEYSSHLVSGSFVPISRNNQSRLKQRRKGALKALRDLKVKLSSKNSKDQVESCRRKVVEPRKLKNKNVAQAKTIRTKNNQQVETSCHFDLLPNSGIAETTHQVLGQNEKSDRFFVYSDCVEQSPPDNEHIYRCVKADESRTMKDGTNFVSPTEISSFDTAVTEYTHLESFPSVNIREQRNENYNLTYTEYSDSLSFVNETVFPHQNDHTLSFDVFKNNNTQSQNHSSKIPHLRQYKSSSVAELPVFEEPYETVEDYQHFKQPKSCYFQDTTTYGDELGQGEKLDNQWFDEYDSIITHDHYIQRRQSIPHPNDNMITAKENELLEQMNHFQCL